MSRSPRSRPDPRGQLYPTLDLHGLTGDEARHVAERWLRAERAAGELAVRLITGRGKRSAGPPVLRGEIEALLHELTPGLVERFTLDTPGGAFLVHLNRHLPSPPQGPRGGRLSRRVPAELRRRAEESLAELGVSPTPELLDAEIRRLLAEEEG
jgi:hypothetical protein